MLVEKGEKKIQTLDAQGADGITPAELMRNDHDPYKAVVSARLEALGQILTYAEKIAQECSETVIFPATAPDSHLEGQYEDQQSGSNDY